MWQDRGMRILRMAGPGLAAAVAMVAAAGDARADERRTAVSLGFVVGAQSQPQPLDGTGSLGQGFGGPRLTLGFEDPPLPYPAQPGSAVDTCLVPELIAGAFLSDALLEGMIGVGLRGELRLSQKQQGLLRVTMRGVFYAAARALVVGDGHDFFGELVFGEHILLGRAARVGFSIGGMRRAAGGMDGAQTGIVGQVYLGWQL
jgi:hypothetical protein